MSETFACFQTPGRYMLKPTSPPSSAGTKGRKEEDPWDNDDHQAALLSLRCRNTVQSPTTGDWAASEWSKDVDDIGAIP
jgi:hypothetical protein